jgi:hypothetical protein
MKTTGWFLDVFSELTEGRKLQAQSSKLKRMAKLQRTSFCNFQGLFELGAWSFGSSFEV